MPMPTLPTSAELEELARHPTAWRGPQLRLEPERWTVDWHGDLDRLAADITHRLLHGLGFVLVRGAPLEADPDGMGAALLDLSRRMGSLRSQNAGGDLLGHVRDVGLDVDDPNVRIYQTNERQTFHTDSTDAVGLLCRSTAREGGASLLASTVTALLEFDRRHPELTHWLFEPVATDRRGEVPDGMDPWFEIPVLSWFDGHLTGLYQRQYIDSAARFPAAPPLADEHRSALDAFDAVVDDPDVHLSMELEPGDLQFVHNHSLLHDRTGFVDDPKAPRHLLRVWLSLPTDRELPPVFAQRYGSIAVGDRGGIVTADPPRDVPEQIPT